MWESAADESRTPINIRGQDTLVEIASIAAVMGINFQNAHITATVETPTTIDEDGAGSQAGGVPAQLRMGQGEHQGGAHRSRSPRTKRLPWMPAPHPQPAHLRAAGRAHAPTAGA